MENGSEQNMQNNQNDQTTNTQNELKNFNSGLIEQAWYDAQEASFTIEDLNSRNHENISTAGFDDKFL